MSSLEATATQAQNEIIAQLNDVLEQKGVKDRVLQDAQEIASLASNHILDPSKEPLKTWTGVGEENKLEIQLVYDFLKQAGFNFASNCFKFETQHPDIIDEFDRRKLGKECNLCTYDRTPYLVQIIREIQRQEN